MSDRRASTGRALRAERALIWVALAMLCVVGTRTEPAAAAPPCSIDGTAANDRLVGTPADDVVCGGGGRDRIAGRGGADLVVAGPGRDAVRTGAGSDVLRGGGGDDVLRGERDADLLAGGAGDDKLFGGGGENRCGRRVREFSDRGCMGEAATVTDVTISPGPRIDTSGADQEVTIAVRIEDGWGYQGSADGVHGARLFMKDPLEPDFSGETWEMKLRSGTRFDGIWAATRRLPRHSTPGRYELMIQLRDSHHLSNVTPEQLRARGLVDAVEQVGPGDMGPPTLTSLTVDPAQVDTSAKPAEISISAGVNDDLLGTEAVWAWLRGPRGLSGYQELLELSAGNRYSGTWSGGLPLPAGAATGTWSVELYTRDEFGNRWYEDAEMQAHGFANRFVQSGASDDLAPELDGFAVEPARVSASANETIQFTIDARDNLSGFQWGFVQLRSTADGSGGGIFSVGLRVSGTDLDGTWWESYPSGRLAPGSYQLSLELQDHALNKRIYSAADLGNAGLPNSLIVDP